MPRIAARAIILYEDKLLIVNAWKGHTRLWCLPGGGAEDHSSLPENLAREVMEECGLEIEVGGPCLVNEFHDPKRKFHQIEVFFRCRLLDGDPFGPWTDPEGIVAHRRWVTRDELKTLPHKPSSLADVAWGTGEATYDPLELIVE
ncbi:ADP-ribose pyrophosphatase YjhB, NUDIX family [Cognatiyoonia sediminum]|uniref:ADP-ribose pyrophosphatase YjhB, NUDIX family n=1 Tax=Cognatiyoonia sediminum TaxID=1508389 RepID=A0A1M5NRD6_9RHOB|nr:NUDIX hydrolase [Cognatiyoonia sediminum]SHG92136.1 ADP-ribose pyrophosphatase YjhB, NUDIX family [Cognatiyoonia sediminum]